MSIDVEKLAARVAALEQQRLASVAAAADEKKDEPKADEKKATSERDVLAAEIEALERKLGSTNGTSIPSEVTMADVQPRTAADEKKDDEKKDEAKDEKKASLVDPNGVEEQITQKRFTEVEDLEHGTELATGDSALDVAPTEYVARLKSASERLDAVANYLEATGRTAMALRIDKIANAIDARVAKVTKPA